MADGELFPLLSRDLLVALEKLDEQAEDWRDPDRLWAVPDVPFDVRATAEWQARNCGEPLGAWLTAAILNHARAIEAATRDVQVQAEDVEPSLLVEPACEAVVWEPAICETVDLDLIEAPAAIEPEPEAKLESLLVVESEPEIDPEAVTGGGNEPCDLAFDPLFDAEAAETVGEEPLDVVLFEDVAMAEEAPLEAVIEECDPPAFAPAPVFQPTNTLHGGSGMDMIRETIHGIIAYAAPAPMPAAARVTGDGLAAEVDDGPSPIAPLAAWTPPEVSEPEPKVAEAEALVFLAGDAPETPVARPRRSWLGRLFGGRR